MIPTTRRSAPDVAAADVLLVRCITYPVHRPILLLVWPRQRDFNDSQRAELRNGCHFRAAGDLRVEPRVYSCGSCRISTAGRSIAGAASGCPSSCLSISWRSMAASTVASSGRFPSGPSGNGDLFLDWLHALRDLADAGRHRHVSVIGRCRRSSPAFSALGYFNNERTRSPRGSAALHGVGRCRHHRLGWPSARDNMIGILVALLVPMSFARSRPSTLRRYRSLRHGAGDLRRRLHHLRARGPDGLCRWAAMRAAASRFPWEHFCWR
jgi:hypothetical protein